MSQRVENISKRIYGTTWEVLSGVFKVPQTPPHLPVPFGETVESFRPAEGFLRYLKLQFWLGLLLIDVLILIAWIAIMVAAPIVGVILAIPALALAVLPDIVAYVAIHLRFDTTWYVMSPHSLRLRRGIWVIHETTITFENVQNVTVRQGPLQRWYGIADVLVETAGGGGGDSHPSKGGSGIAHRGLIEGVADAERIRDLLLTRLRQSKHAGLGDERPTPMARRMWTPEHRQALREIRDALRQQVAAEGHKGLERGEILVGWDQASHTPRESEKTFRAAATRTRLPPRSARPEATRRCCSSTVNTGLWWAGGSASKSAQPNRMLAWCHPTWR